MISPISFKIYKLTNNPVDYYQMNKYIITHGETKSNLLCEYLNMKISEAKTLARQSSSRKEFKAKHTEAYKILRRANELSFLDRLFPRKVRWKIFELEQVIEDYDKLGEFYKENPGAYQRILKHPRLKKKLDKLKRERVFWEKENIEKEAKKHKSRLDFSIASAGAYECARVNRWLDEVCEHMDKEPFTTKDLEQAAKDYENKRTRLKEGNRRLYEWGRKEEKRLFDKLFPTNYPQRIQ